MRIDKRWWAVAALALAVVLFFVLDLGQYLRLSTIKSSQAQLEAWRAAQPLQTALIFFALYVLATALSLPGAVVLTLAGGAIFGLLGILLAVPVAAWAGIFCAEMMIRNRRFHAPSLLIRGGVYPDVRWINLIAFLVITVIGLGFTTADVTGLTWEGYALHLFGIPAQDPVSMSDLGVLLALVLGLLVPLVSAIGTIRAQEETRAGSSGAGS